MISRFFYRSLLPCALILLIVPHGLAQQVVPVTPTNAAPTTPTDPSQKMIADAMTRMNANDVDGALNSLTQAIKLNPKSTGAYVLRASIYCQKKLWSQAEDDFNAAAKIAPTNTVLKFNVIEVKFMQKQYDVARSGFLALEKDPDMGDFAAYKVFLCDLVAGHEAVAKKELDVFNDAESNPSYFFSNAAWSITHKKYDDANGWLQSAAHIYSRAKLEYYAKPLVDLGYLPLPTPAAK